MHLNGSVSYASQDPWVYSATIRENVLFGKPYDEKFYSRVIKACALDKVDTLSYSYYYFNNCLMCRTLNCL